jgi:hypothetical protein
MSKFFISPCQTNCITPNSSLIVSYKHSIQKLPSSIAMYYQSKHNKLLPNGMISENKISLCYRLVQRYADIIAHLWYESF